MRGGHGAAVVELRRRWPGISDRSAAVLISIILTIDANGAHGDDGSNAQ